MPRPGGSEDRPAPGGLARPFHTSFRWTPGAWRAGMFAVVALTAAAGMACSGDEANAVDQEILQAGEDAYIISCARCHQRDGVGYSTIYPALAGSPFVTLEDPRPLIETILEGPGSMPAFREALEPDQIAAIATYIRNSWGNEASPVEARDVR